MSNYSRSVLYACIRECHSLLSAFTHHIMTLLIKLSVYLSSEVDKILNDHGYSCEISTHITLPLEIDLYLYPFILFYSIHSVLFIFHYTQAIHFSVQITENRNSCTAVQFPQVYSGQKGRHFSTLNITNYLSCVVQKNNQR